MRFDFKDFTGLYVLFSSNGDKDTQWHYRSFGNAGNAFAFGTIQFNDGSTCFGETLANIIVLKAKPQVSLYQNYAGLYAVIFAL